MEHKTKEWISKEKRQYAKYFFHRDGPLWHCIAHLHLGEHNDTTYHVSAPKKKQTISAARKHVELRCRYLNRSHKRKKVKVVSDNYEPDPNLLSIDKALPTSREDDIPDDGVNGDSLPHPFVTKEELDEELDEYWNKKKLENVEEKNEDTDCELPDLEPPSPTSGCKSPRKKVRHGKLKEFTGGDVITTRPLFTQVKPGDKDFKKSSL